MSFNATVYRILIASPGDIGEERNIIPEVVNEWNAVSSYATKIILMPLKWETNTTPRLGARPQEIINKQIVEDADLLVGVFWTRIGTDTGVAISGTAEEIQQFVDADKPVMLYFSQSPIEPDKIDINQFTALKKFKEKMRLKGLTETYSGTGDFRQKFTRQLGINLNTLIDARASELKAKGKEPSLKATAAQKDAVESLTMLSAEDAKEYLLKAWMETSREDGGADMAALATYISKYTLVDYRQFGYAKLKPYLESTGLFELKQVSKTQVDVTLAKNKKGRVLIKR